MFKSLSLLGLAHTASAAFDAAASYNYSVDSSTKYITLAPKTTHSQTMIYLHGGDGSAASAYTYIFKTNQVTPLTTKIVIVNAPVIGSSSSNYVWYSEGAKGSEVIDSLGNSILAT